MRRKRSRFVGLLLLLSGFALAAAADDRFIEGYATAVLERDLGLVPLAVEAEDGVLVVHLRSLAGRSAMRIRTALKEIRGVRRVEIRRVSTSGAGRTGESESAGAAESAGRAGSPEGAEEDRLGLEVLPRRELFDPLIADVRWPHFSVSALWYLDDPALTHLGSTNFAESFALLAGDLGKSSRWELGLQAGVYSIFDLDAGSSDLVNSDYVVGPTLAFSSGRYTGLLRVFHQSSHLGDEYLLRNRPRRVNLSYEEVDGLLSIDLAEEARVYSGVGYVFRTEPEVHPLSVQAGLELESPWSALRGIVRPIAATDLNWTEEDHWTLDLSVRAGLLFENPRLSKLRLRLLFEYFQGHSPNGQFFQRRIEYAGMGLHLEL